MKGIAVFGEGAMLNVERHPFVGGFAQKILRLGGGKRKLKIVVTSPKSEKSRSESSTAACQTERTLGGLKA